MVAELQQVVKIYETPGSEIQAKVLDGISLTIHQGETLAITGPSGSGKSTLLNILGTFDKPTSGQVLLDGSPVLLTNERLVSELRNRYLGFVFQLHHLLPQLSLLENVLLPLLPNKDKSQHKAATESALHLLEKVGLKDHLHNKPSQLSVGECQRAAVVRALINHPRLLLADEPTGSLDADNAALLIQLLLELKQELEFSMVIVTHSSVLAKNMDTVYHLAGSKLTKLQLTT